MPGFPRSQLLFAAGGDVLAKYGTLTRRYQTPARGGEGLKESFTRAGAAWAVGKGGLLVPYAANVPRVEYVLDPVTGLLQSYWLLEAAGTNLIENSDCEADIVGWGVTAGGAVSRDNVQAFSGSWSCKLVTANLDDSGATLTPRAGGRFAAAAGTTYTFSCSIYAPAASVGKTLRLLIEWWNAVPAFISSTPVVNIVLVAGWQRLSVTGLAPGGTVTATPRLSQTGAQGVNTYWLDVPNFEAQAFPTSPIATGVGAVVRGVDNCTAPWYLGPSAMWFYLRFLERGAVTIGAGECWQIGTFPGRVLMQGSGGKYRLFHDTQGGANVATANGPTPAFGDAVELLGLLNADGSAAFRSSLNNGAEVIATPAGALALDATWTAPLRLQVGGGQDGNQPLALSRFLIGLGPGALVSTLADARAIPV